MQIDEFTEVASLFWFVWYINIHEVEEMLIVKPLPIPTPGKEIFKLTP